MAKMGRPPGSKNKNSWGPGGRPKEARRNNPEERWGIKPYALEERHEKAIELLSCGFSTAAAGECLGVTSTTISYWKRNPIFRDRLAEVIGIDATLHKTELVRLYGKSLERVDALLDSKNEQVRLQASRLIMEAHAATVRLAEEREMLSALEARMDALQSAADAGQPLLEEAEIVDVETD
jgi:hypothetical protein